MLSMALASVSAIGAVPPNPACRPVLAQVAAAKAAAEKAVAKGDVATANRLFDDALSALGYRYATPALIDDSGMRLVLASVELDKGRPKQAALLKRRVLEDRMTLCGAGTSP